MIVFLVMTGLSDAFCKVVAIVILFGNTIMSITVYQPLCKMILIMIYNLILIIVYIQLYIDSVFYIVNIYLYLLCIYHTPSTLI
jgi:hypothetical protein